MWDVIYSSLFRFDSFLFRVYSDFLFLFTHVLIQHCILIKLCCPLIIWNGMITKVLWCSFSLRFTVAWGYIFLYPGWNNPVLNIYLIQLYYEKMFLFTNPQNEIKPSISMQILVTDNIHTMFNCLNIPPTDISFWRYSGKSFLEFEGIEVDGVFSVTVRFWTESMYGTLLYSASVKKGIFFIKFYISSGTLWVILQMHIHLWFLCVCFSKLSHYFYKSKNMHEK